MNTGKQMKTRILSLSMLIVGILILGACSPLEGENLIDPSPAAIPTQIKVMPGDSLPDDEASRLMYALLESSETEFKQAVEAIIAAQDTRFIPVFIELFRANQLSLIGDIDFRIPIDALEFLSGQPLGNDWPAWIEWYGKTDLIPPSGFTSWKGQLLGRIDPGFSDFLQDDFPTTIRAEEILWGGVPVDGIPALDNAAMIPASEASYLEAEEPVFGISINGDHRAYPLRILDWHEMANDVVGGVPISLAYCTLCGAGIAYDGRASNGETYTFGSSGFLYRSNKLMYDRQTRTLWNQLTGEPVLGKLVGSDVSLKLQPVVITTWDSWLSQHPDTQVLDINTGFQRPYVPGAAYGDYFAYHDTMFPVWLRSDLLPTKDRIFALQVEGIPKAYPLDILSEEQVVNDTIGNTSVVLIASRGDIQVEGTNQRAGQVSYDAGGEVRAYASDSQTFTPGSESDTVMDSAGDIWKVTEEALVGPNGDRAPRLSGHLAYWFGWYSFFPQTLLYDPADSQSGQTIDDEQPSLPTVTLKDLGPAPELTNETWINSETPLRLADLRGQVVLLEMWTFG
jgi:hypothetical protein